MKTLKVKTLRKGSKARKQIISFIELWQKMAKCYFWTPPAGASSRRNYEKMNSESIDIEINGIRYQGRIVTDCSCKNVYCLRELLIDSETKRITHLKKLLK